MSTDELYVAVLYTHREELISTITDEGHKEQFRAEVEKLHSEQVVQEYAKRLDGKKQNAFRNASEGTIAAIRSGDATVVREGDELVVTDKDGNQIQRVNIEMDGDLVVYDTPLELPNPVIGKTVQEIEFQRTQHEQYHADLLSFGLGRIFDTEQLKVFHEDMQWLWQHRRSMCGFDSSFLGGAHVNVIPFRPDEGMTLYHKMHLRHILETVSGQPFGDDSVEDHAIEPTTLKHGFIDRQLLVGSPGDRRTRWMAMLRESTQKSDTPEKASQGVHNSQ